MTQILINYTKDENNMSVSINSTNIKVFVSTKTDNSKLEMLNNFGNELDTLINKYFGNGNN